ncbi:hypothetical protein AWU65_07660 [Paenibacillus glucanolyticus]|uniref:Glycosyltransferase 2-like domain-containing protein n=1 Tax=Paenibacillus glucanolyticus TaxID=59843 RepID=A0A163I4V1_9BACL|nr:glycosyltransferase [Paenibacillus glucanolyticus]KZS45794.1 hypothetical protein AWU65_07660 [Paenibacillus glucanolyticus]
MMSLTGEISNYIKEGLIEKGYEICFKKLMDDSESSEALSGLAMLSMVCGNHTEAQWYLEKTSMDMNFYMDSELLLRINNIEIKKKWDNYRRLRNQHELKRMAETASLCCGDVLEIGCANGDLSVFIACHGSKLYGIDIDPVAIDIARHKVANLGIETCYFQIGNGYKLQFNDNMFDTVVVAEVLEHVNDPKRIVEEAFRVCKPGGTIIISVPSGYSIPDLDHHNIFNRKLIEGLIYSTTGCSIKWNSKVPSEWIMGTIVKPSVDNYKDQKYDIQSFFLPQPYIIPTSNSLVSVIITTFNRKDYIAETIQSIFDQTYKNIEVIVVDDGSIISPEDELLPYSNDIKYIYKENGGKSSALNEGIKYAHGEYIWVFDDDDVALPLKLEVQLKRFQLNPKLGMVHTRSIDFNDLTGEVIRIHDLSPVKSSLNMKMLMRGCFVHGPTVLFKKSCLVELEGWDTQLIRAQDYDFWLRLARHYDMEYLPAPTVRYRVHTGDRGSLDAPVSYNEIVTKTAKYEQIIFSNLYSTVPINMIYKDEFDSDNITLMIEAFIERATVYAARGLLHEAKLDMKIARDNSIGYGYPCFSAEAIQNIHKLAGAAVNNNWEDHELVSSIYELVNMITGRK